jgi:hypothetical protein
VVEVPVAEVALPVVELDHLLGVDCPPQEYGPVS